VTFGGRVVPDDDFSLVDNVVSGAKMREAVVGLKRCAGLSMRVVISQEFNSYRPSSSKIIVVIVFTVVL